MVINCGTNNLDTDNPDEISDGLICIALLFQKRLKHLQIIVNGIIPRDATNARRRQKLLEVNQLLRDKCTSYNSVYFLKPDTDWTTLDGGLNKTLYYKENIHPSKTETKKLALSIKPKLGNIRINCHDCHQRKSSTNNKGSRLPESRLPEGNNNFVKKSTIKLFHQGKYQAAVTKMPT